jgi:hypothetical protein
VPSLNGCIYNNCEKPAALATDAALTLRRAEGGPSFDHAKPAHEYDEECDAEERDTRMKVHGGG